jgi:NAD-dependent deacetylase
MSKTNSIDIPEFLINTLKNAGAVTILTGAGISAESGIPTFRQAQTGLWSKYDPKDLATPEAFRTNPKLVWEWYRWRRELIYKSYPNQAHKALAKLESYFTHKQKRFTLITQNVDGLHRQAGNQEVIELHGNIMVTRCFECNTVVEEDLFTSTDKLPHCKLCNGLLRPGVVWFGENLPHGVLETAFQASNECEIFLSIGTSGIVQPAASLPMVALQNKALIIEVNPNTTPLTPFTTLSLQGTAVEIIPAITDRVIDPLTQSYSHL